MSDLATLEKSILDQIAAAGDEAALEAVRVASLGRKGSISALLGMLGKMSPDERRTQGAAINSAKDRVTDALAARREGERWIAQLSGGREVSARMVVNAAGPWVAEVLHQRLGADSRAGVRLVKGSHIVVPRLHDGDHAYILQQPDGRVVFALPYGEHSLIGTTDTPVERPEDEAPDAAEIAYLCDAANRYFIRQTNPADVAWSFGGIRALYDDGAAAAKDVTRDYRLELDDDGAKLLSVFGGKITTARALALEVMDKIGVRGLRFTATNHLPGGDLDAYFNDWLRELAHWMPEAMLMRMAQAYGTRLRRVVEDAASLDDLGRHFGADLYEAEVRYLVDKEFAHTAEDILWRRTKLGLRLSPKEQRELGNFVATLVA